MVYSVSTFFNCISTLVVPRSLSSRCLSTLKTHSKSPKRAAVHSKKVSNSTYVAAASDSSPRDTLVTRDLDSMPASCPFSASRSPPTMAIEERTAMTRSYEDIPTPKGLPIIGTFLDIVKSGGAPYIHEYCDNRHKMLGPIYREKMGTTEAVFIADSDMIQKVYQNEGKYPSHLVPEAWILYNNAKKRERGLFFK